MLKWFAVAYETSIKQKLIIQINGIYIVLIKINGNIFAIEDNCPHQNMPINKGNILHDNIICPFHNASFCIKSGLINNTLSIDNLNIFKVRIKNNKIKIKIDFTC